MQTNKMVESIQKNLVNIDITTNDTTITSNLRIATANTRSNKNKVELVIEK